jgi:hypothetical protein
MQFTCNVLISTGRRSRRSDVNLAKMSVLIAALFASTSIVHADAFTPAFMADVQAEGHSQFMTGVRGSCSDKSHIASGRVGTDITNNHRPFNCDAVVIVTFDKQNVHTMITFAEKATTKGVIAFAGLMDAKNNMLFVQKVYFEPGKPTYVDEGACKLFFSGKHMSGIYCGGKIDADGQRTVASIVFDAEPGQ